MCFFVCVCVPVCNVCAHTGVDTHTARRSAFHEWNNRYTTIQRLSSATTGDETLSAPTGGALCNERRSQWPGKFAEDEMAFFRVSYFSFLSFPRVPPLSHTRRRRRRRRAGRNRKSRTKKSSNSFDPGDEETASEESLSIIKCTLQGGATLDYNTSSLL